MYSIDGAFGQVRLIQFPQGIQLIQGADVPFHFKNAGWHRCNDLYRITRENSQSGHLLLFSLNDGGMLELEDHPPIPLPASSAAWIPLQHKHSYYTRPGQLWEFYWLDVAEDPCLQFDKVFGKQSILHIVNIDEISREIESLLRNRGLSRPALKVESSRIIGNIYHVLLQESLLQTNMVKQDELVQRIIRDMESRCDDDWNLSKISQNHYISVPQLIRRFKAETGMTPHAYLTMLRLQTAEMHLKYSNQAIDEISRKTGFRNVSNFIQQFRKAYGATPARYRDNK